MSLGALVVFKPTSPLQLYNCTLNQPWISERTSTGASQKKGTP